MDDRWEKNYISCRFEKWECLQINKNNQKSLLHLQMHPRRMFQRTLTSTWMPLKQKRQLLPSSHSSGSSRRRRMKKSPSGSRQNLSWLAHQRGVTWCCMWKNLILYRLKEWGVAGAKTQPFNFWETSLCILFVNHCIKKVRYLHWEFSCSHLFLCSYNLQIS